MEWLLVLCVMIGDYLNVYKKWQGFIFWLITDTTYGIINVIAGEYAESCVFFLYTLFECIGIYKWKSDPSKNRLNDAHI